VSGNCTSFAAFENCQLYNHCHLKRCKSHKNCLLERCRFLQPQRVVRDRSYLRLLRDDELMEEHPSDACVVQHREWMYVDFHAAPDRPVCPIVTQLRCVAEEGARDAPPDLACVTSARDERHAELLDVGLRKCDG
jgi:hypothetical protein